MDRRGLCSSFADTACEEGIIDSGWDMVASFLGFNAQAPPGLRDVRRVGRARHARPWRWRPLLMVLSAIRCADDSRVLVDDSSSLALALAVILLESFELVWCPRSTVASTPGTFTSSIVSGRGGVSFPTRSALWSSTALLVSVFSVRRIDSWPDLFLSFFDVKFVLILFRRGRQVYCTLRLDVDELSNAVARALFMLLILWKLSGFERPGS